jgi:ubiquinone/menaquinone biosynthesis C-methylase UbiE
VLLSWLYRKKGTLPDAVFQTLERVLWFRYWFQLEDQLSRETGERIRDLRESERGVLIEALVRSYPFKKILEFGCGYGLNFQTLASVLSDVEFTGVDKNLSVLEQARLNCSGISAKFFNIERDLPFADNSFEISYSIAALLYVDSGSIRQILNELVRVASRKVIIVEQNLEQGEVFVTRGYSGYWLRDYHSLLESIPKVSSISRRKIEKARFDTEQWQDYGTILEIDLHG